MRLGNTILRWVMAPVGAAVASALGFIVSVLIGLVFFDRAELNDRSSGSGAVVATTIIAVSTMAWVVAGSAIAPPRHRRVAVALFSSPLILLILSFLARLYVGQLEPRQVYLGVGFALACVGLIVLIVFRWFWVRTAERRKMIQNTANVFSDESDQKQKALG